MQHLKEIVLPNYPLILSLLKYRNVWVFWNKKKSGSNRCSLLNSSIDYFAKARKSISGSVSNSIRLLLPFNYLFFYFLFFSFYLFHLNFIIFNLSLFVLLWKYCENIIVILDLLYALCTCNNFLFLFI